MKPVIPDYDWIIFGVRVTHAATGARLCGYHRHCSFRHTFAVSVFQLVVALLTLAALLRMLAVLTVPVVRLQFMAYRSDPVTIAEGTQQRHYFFHRRSNSAFAK
jgi:hypothetical protein